MLVRPPSLRAVLGVIVIVVVLSALVSARFNYFNAWSGGRSRWVRPTPPEARDASCHRVAGEDDIVVVVKTGANEIYDKLPTQLLTGLRCQRDPELLIFSDLEHRIGPFQVQDALKNVADSVKAQNAHFDYYRTLQEYQRTGQDVTGLRQTSHQAAWVLDRYKFLHMLQDTWTLRPRRKWYVFIEADTYLVRSNLFPWLARLDPSQLLYLGSRTYVNGREFGHGGSGIILSGAALAQFADRDPGVAARYDEVLTHEGLGDYVLATALREKGVNFTSQWPMLQAEKPSTIPFGPGPDNGVRHWCQPIITMHHITPQEACDIWSFEQEREAPAAPLLLRDLYQGMIKPQVATKREDWYNLSDDIMYRAPGVVGERQKPPNDMSALERDAYLSWEHCGRACEEHPRCFQYVYSAQECGFSYSYRLGRKRLPESGKTFTSGWDLAKIARDQEAHQCASAEWL